jgi:ribose transport system substrate-binding protein
MKTKLRTWLFLVSAVAMVLLVSCEKSAHESSERYVFVANNISLPYWAETKAGFDDAAQRMGLKTEFVGPTSYSPEDELKAFQNASAGNPSGILVSPARPAMFKDAIDSAVKQGIPVICVDSDSPESRRVMFIGTDNYRAGLESGQRLVEVMHEHGRAVVLTVPGQLNLDERLRGVQEVLKEYSHISVAYVYNDQGSPDTAQQEINELLGKDKDVQAILCLEASGGPGAAKALDQAAMTGKIYIVAMDANPDTLTGISKGLVTATVAQKPYTMGFYGLEYLDDLHHNRVHQFKDWRSAPTSPLPAYIDTGTSVIDGRNVEEFISAHVERTGKA